MAKYIFYSEVFKKNVQHLRSAFKDAGLQLCLGYSVKTNNHPQVLNKARECGMMAEIVSRDEFELALGCDFDFDSIIYNGVIPDPEFKFLVAAKGGIVNINSYTELEMIEKIATDSKIKIKLGIRVNIDIGTELPSRFGIRPYSEEFAKCMELFNSSEYIMLAGMHCHTSFARDLKYWKAKARRLSELAIEYNLEYIDFGSNFFGDMHFDMIEFYDYDTVTFDEYAATIANEISNRFPEGRGPMIVLEPGTPVVSNAVDIFCEVTNIKELCGKTLIEVDCSAFDFRTITKKRFNPINVIRNSKGVHVNGANIVGNTCVELDVIQYDFDGDIAIGDFLLIRNIGAYSVSKASDFITKKLDMVTI